MTAHAPTKDRWLRPVKAGSWRLSRRVPSLLAGQRGPARRGTPSSPAAGYGGPTPTPGHTLTSAVHCDGRPAPADTGGSCRPRSCCSQDPPHPPPRVYSLSGNSVRPCRVRPPSLQAPYSAAVRIHRATGVGTRVTSPQQQLHFCLSLPSLLPFGKLKPHDDITFLLPQENSSSTFGHPLGNCAVFTILDSPFHAETRLGWPAHLPPALH